MKLPSRETQDFVRSLGTIANANRAYENLSKHALMIHFHNNQAITDEEFEIYKKSRKNLFILQVLIPLITSIIAFSIICYIEKPSDINIIMAIAGLAVVIMILVMVICFCISLFTKSRKYLYLYDKWYAKRGGYATDLHFIFNPDGWKAVSNANSLLECALTIAIFLGIIIFTIVMNP